MDIEDLEITRLCFNCVGEEFLSQEIHNNGEEDTCSYCQSVDKTFSIYEISDRIEQAFANHYIRTPDEPSAFEYALSRDDDMDSDWERGGEPVIESIMDAAQIPNNAAKDIQLILSSRYEEHGSDYTGDETEFSDDSFYEIKHAEDSSWQHEWNSLEKSFKSESRFFNSIAISCLERIFDNLDKMRTSIGSSLFIDAGPGSSLEFIYRARVFQSDESLKLALARPDLHIGPPPSNHARPGRMNANGISVFYGANDPETALAEVRPPVGSKVVIARFNILRSIRLLDLSALEDIHEKGSIFDPDYILRIQKAVFLKSLADRITKPVMPDDEAFEYLVTQAISDFLANKDNPVIDGVVFRSVQTAGNSLNIVLFHKSSKVEKIEVLDDTEINVSLGWHTEDGWEPDYSVTKRVPSPTKYEDTEADSWIRGFLPDPPDFSECRNVEHDYRAEKLRIDIDSIKVHEIRAVKFDSFEHSVSNNVYQKNWITNNLIK